MKAGLFMAKSREIILLGIAEGLAIKKDLIPFDR